MKNSARNLSFFVLASCSLFHPHLSRAQTPSRNLAAPTVESALPNAPEAQRQIQSSSSATNGLAAGAAPIAQKYASVIEPGETPQRLSGRDKMIFALRQDARPINLLPALYSAGYEQLTGHDPKYGSDSGAGAVKFGAAMLGSTITRTLSNGVFAATFHQDPRYYRIANGPIVNRGLRSAEQALMRRGDDGEEQVNASGLIGRAAAAVLILAYYPSPSRRTGVVVSTFGTSIATDAGGDLVLEFLPDLARKFPILKKFLVN